MTRSKTWAILDKTRPNAWLKNMIGHNSGVVSEWKENFRLSQPTPSIFLAAFCFSFSRRQTELFENALQRGGI